MNKGIIFKETSYDGDASYQTCIVDIDDIAHFSEENGKTHITCVKAGYCQSHLADVEFNDFIRLLEDAERSGQ